MKPTVHLRRSPSATAGGAVQDITSIAPANDAAAITSTERGRRIWSAGAYDRIAEGFRAEAEAFVLRRDLRAGTKVLDVACGSGNLTIPAARTGAQLTGLDLVSSLLAIASDRASSEGLSIALDEGNAEELPYADGQFDVVLSMFGVMFAARPERVVSELARVTRVGGQAVLANWVSTGFVGKMLRMHSALVRPPAGSTSPLVWGDESWIRAQFDSAAWTLEFIPRVLEFDFPLTPAGTAELFRGSYGPSVRTFEALGENERAALASQLSDHWTTHHRGGEGHTLVDAEYVEVIATRR